ncbi:hypothetical protein NFJ02_25g57670 [Pycnococcus provasolii]
MEPGQVGMADKGFHAAAYLLAKSGVSMTVPPKRARGQKILSVINGGDGEYCKSTDSCGAFIQGTKEYIRIGTMSYVSACGHASPARKS